jgi:hypothetical protein
MRHQQRGSTNVLRRSIELTAHSCLSEIVITSRPEVTDQVYANTHYSYFSSMFSVTSVVQIMLLLSLSIISYLASALSVK